MERLASEAIELSTRQNLATWLPTTVLLRGCTRSALGDIREGIEWIADGLRDMRAGASLTMPFMLALKSEAFYLAGRTPDALEVVAAGL